MAYYDLMQTSGKKNTTEWWYFDFLFENGVKVVLSVFTKYYFNASHNGLKPKMHICALYPDGRKFARSIKNDKGLRFDFAKDELDIKVGASRIYKRKNVYICNFITDEISFDAKIDSDYNYDYLDVFDYEKRLLYWNVSVPCGKVCAKLKIGEDEQILNGVVYHDHNWSTERLNRMMTEWKWMRFTADGKTYVVFDVIKKDGRDLRGYEFGEGKVITHKDVIVGKELSISPELSYYEDIDIGGHRIKIIDYAEFIKGNVGNKINVKNKFLRSIVEKIIIIKAGARAYRRYSLQATVDGKPADGNIEYINLD